MSTFLQVSLLFSFFVKRLLLPPSPPPSIYICTRIYLNRIMFIHIISLPRISFYFYHRTYLKSPFFAELVGANPAAVESKSVGGWNPFLEPNEHPHVAVVSRASIIHVGGCVRGSTDERRRHQSAKAKDHARAGFEPCSADASRRREKRRKRKNKETS